MAATFLVFKIVCAVVVFGFFARIAYIMYDDLRNTPVDQRDSFGEVLRIGAGSLTKAWLRLVALVSSALSFITMAVPALQMPEAQAAIQKYLPADYVTVTILVIAVIGLFARSRSTDDGRVL